MFRMIMCKFWRPVFILCGQNAKRANCTQAKAFHKTMEGALMSNMGDIPEFPMVLHASHVAEKFTHQLCISVLFYQIQITAFPCREAETFMLWNIYIVHIRVPAAHNRLKFCHQLKKELQFLFLKWLSYF